MMTGGYHTHLISRVWFFDPRMRWYLAQCMLMKAKQDIGENISTKIHLISLLTSFSITEDWVWTDWVAMSWNSFVLHFVTRTERCAWLGECQYHDEAAWPGTDWPGLVVGHWSSGLCLYPVRAINPAVPWAKPCCSFITLAFPSFVILCGGTKTGFCDHRDLSRHLAEHGCQCFSFPCSLGTAFQCVVVRIISRGSLSCHLFNYLPPFTTQMG